LAGATVVQSALRDPGRILHESARQLTSTLASGEVVTRLLQSALDLLDAEIASVLTFDAQGLLRIRSAFGLSPDIVEGTRIAVGEGISGYVARTRAGLLVADVETDPRFGRQSHARYSTRSLISAPIVYQDRLSGVVNVNNRRGQQVWTADHLTLLEDLAGHAAVALQNAERYEALLERARRDGLTGLVNRSHLWAVLETELARARRYERPVSVVMIDVDHFKAYNDQHGHLEGDRVLARVAGQIRSLSRASDTAGRYGGEEFAIILPETPIDGGVRLAEKIRASIEASDGGGSVTISAGVAAFPVHGRTPRKLLQAADRQLYQAKARGRNQVCHPSDGVLR